MIIKKLNKPAMTREYLKERIYWSITLLAVDLGIYAHIDNTTVGQAFWIIITTVLWLWLASLFAELLSYKVFNESLCEGKRKEEFHNSLWVLSSSTMSLFMLWLAFFSIITLKSAILWAIIANVMVLTFIYSWNDYLIPLLVMRNEQNYTVTLAAQYFVSSTYQSPEDVARIYAVMLLLTLPSILVYLFSQKFLVVGIASGSVKG